VRGGVARRRLARHALAGHMIRRTALPSQRPWQCRPVGRLSWRGSRRRCGVRSQSAPRAGRASLPHSPTTALDALRPRRARRATTRRGMPARVSRSRIPSRLGWTTRARSLARRNTRDASAVSVHTCGTPGAVTHRTIVRADRLASSHVCAIGRRNGVADMDRAVHNEVRCQPSSDNAVTSGWRQQGPASSSQLTGTAHDVWRLSAVTSDRAV
jgi:hypothetical protein